MNGLERKKHIKKLLFELGLKDSDLARLLGDTTQAVNFNMAKDIISEKIYLKYLKALQPKLKDVSIGGNYISGDLEGVNIINNNEDAMGDQIGKQEIHGANGQMGSKIVDILEKVIDNKESTINDKDTIIKQLTDHTNQLQAMITERDVRNKSLEERLKGYDIHVEKEEKAIEHVMEQLSTFMSQLDGHMKECEKCKNHDTWAKEIKKAILKELKEIKQQVLLRDE